MERLPVTYKTNKNSNDNQKVRFMFVKTPGCLISEDVLLNTERVLTSVKQTLVQTVTRLKNIFGLIALAIVVDSKNVLK